MNEISGEQSAELLWRSAQQLAANSGLAWDQLSSNGKMSYVLRVVQTEQPAATKH